MYIHEFNLNDFQQYLSTQQLPAEFASPIVSFEKAGEGNMNFTFRLRFASNASLIIKQAPPYCAKFPEIDAPQQRITFESQFYALTDDYKEISMYFPVVIAFDRKRHILLMEDLGNTKDFTHLYQGAKLSELDAQQITSALSLINSIAPEQTIENSGMRALNHAHIYDIPLRRNNGLDLDSITLGLDKLAQKLINETAYTKLAYELGQEYLAQGNYLLHGDYYPGSWLACVNNIAIIDPEFCFTGAIEFDFGVLLAHLVISQQSSSVVANILADYQPTQGYDKDLALRFAGIEIMRRIIGYAQLPITANLRRKQTLLEQSMELVRNPNSKILLC